MKATRQLTIESQVLNVPARIQRCGKGWQVRYLGTKLYSDGTEGPRKALQAAVRDLEARYEATPPKDRIGVRVVPLKHKTSKLPPGISGPVLTRRRGQLCAEFKVSLPRRGRPNGGTTVYIASESTWSQQRYDTALAKALAIRADAVRAALR